MGHYSGVAQVKKGCSTARMAPAEPRARSKAPPGIRLKCGDCGGYGHNGGDPRCPRFAEVAAFAQAHEQNMKAQQRALELIPAVPPLPPPQAYQNKRRKEKKKTLEMACNSCNGKKMFWEADGQDYVCSNRNPPLRCRGTRPGPTSSAAAAADSSRV